jgi:hypothetical protein
MYIEFRLPQGAGGAAAGMALGQIRKDLEAWFQKYSIQNYRTKIYKYTYRLSLGDDKAYTHFALTWEPKHAVSKNFSFISPK